MDFKGKVFIVSGSNSGIGKACAEALINADATVIGLDVKAPSIEHVRYRHYIVNVRDEIKIKTILDAIETEFKKIDGLINSAGVFASQKPFYELSTEEWNRVIETNLTGTFILSKYAAQKMIPYQSGRIVNINCIRSMIFRPKMTDYAASKGGVGALTSAMALDLAPHNIRVNSVAPGFIHTGLTAQAFDNPEIRKFSESLIPMGRIGQPQDIANVVLFLLSDLADYMTGETLFVDGGYKILK